MSEKEEAKKRIDELCEKISYYSAAYYEADESEISDEEFDMLLRELSELELRFPELIRADSPTRHVLGQATSRFEKVTHVHSQLSLANAFSEADLLAFDQRAKKLTDKKYSYVCEYKFDGLTVVLTYKSGHLVLGATRGDGVIGENVTENIKTIKTVPQKLSFPDDLTVRGEVVFPKEEFFKINEQRIEEGLAPFSNPRNAAAGSLRQLDSRVSAERPLEIFVFNLESISGKTFATHSETLDYLKSAGFQVSRYQKAQSINEAAAFIKSIEQKRESLPFEIDGAVLKIDELDIREQLGSTSKTPRWAIAYKFYATQKQTKLADIALQVGRSGAITPVAVLEPVVIAGSIVARATLHNQDYIALKDLRIGDTVVVRKAGDVIPEVVCSLSEMRDGSEKIFEMPGLCPVCGSSAVREEGNAALKCTNPLCPAQSIRKVQHFVSRNAMNIEGLGESLVERLMNEKLIESPCDIYKLKNHRQTLTALSGLGEKSVDNLLGAIEKSKSAPFKDFLFALGIEFVGKHAALLLSKRFTDISALNEASEEVLMEIDEIGPQTAFSVTSFFEKEENLVLIKELDSLGVISAGAAQGKTPQQEKPEEKTDNRFEGISFVLTGTLPGLTRSEAEEIITSFGGKTSGSVSKKTGYVLAGAAPGSKLTKAEELNVKIINEEEFLQMIK